MAVHQNVVKVLRDVRESYWFVPSLMAVAAVVLAFVTARLDAIFQPTFLAHTSWLYQNEPAGARAVLAAIATSMIGVAGVTFSMTIVSVSFAAANLGPRLIANFMRDTGNQVTLGTFIATFLYCLLTLRTVTDASSASESAASAAAHVPNISLIVALTLTLASIGVLIYFIHHIPESINVARITSQIGTALQNSVDNLIQTARDGDGNDRPGPSDVPPFAQARAVNATVSGYLQAVDHNILWTLASEHDLIVRVEYRPGDFAVEGSALARVIGEVDDALESRLCDTFVFGHERTSAQDTLFLVDQLVEILARALSPGVNDPFTAVSCIDWLRRSLARMVNVTPESPYRYDDSGTLRIVVHPLTFALVADAVFDQALQYVASDRIAALHMMHTLGELVALADHPATTERLLEHARRLNDAGQSSLGFDAARSDLAERFRGVKQIATDPQFLARLKDTPGWLGGNG